MEKPPQKTKLLQWHPAFSAGFQIDLGECRDKLYFEMEHQLSKMPMKMDLLVVKKEKSFQISKNIGRIFRGYNIVEFKSPEDYMSIDDFYKVYGYACFYKADTGNEDKIAIEELTITLVSVRYPIKLINHLKSARGLVVEAVEEGIYYVIGDLIPIQIIVTSRLSDEKNLWLKNLTNRIEETSARKLIEEYRKHEDENPYKAVMDIIVRANQNTFREASGMLCDALNELMQEKIQKELEAALQEGERRGRKEGRQEGERKGRQEGKQSVISNLLRQKILSKEQIAEAASVDCRYVEKLAKQIL